MTPLVSVRFVQHLASAWVFALGMFLMVAPPLSVAASLTVLALGVVIIPAILVNSGLVIRPSELGAL